MHLCILSSSENKIKIRRILLENRISKVKSKHNNEKEKRERMNTIENPTKSKKQKYDQESDKFNDELLRKGTFRVKAIVDDSFTTIEPVLGNES